MLTTSILRLRVRPKVTMMHQLLIMAPGLHTSQIRTRMCLPTLQMFTMLDKRLMISETIQMTKVANPRNGAVIYHRVRWFGQKILDSVFVI